MRRPSGSRIGRDVVEATCFHTGVGITGVAWVDGLFVLFFLGIGGLIYTTTIEDFGETSNRTFNTAEAEWEKPPPPEPSPNGPFDDD